jgi:hypothetical protein
MRANDQLLLATGRGTGLAALSAADRVAAAL